MATTAARNEPFTRALGLSVLLHALAMVLAAAPIVRETLAAWQASAPSPVLLPTHSPPQEIEVMVPEVTAVPSPAPPQTFIRTDGLVQAAPSTANGRFISDRNTRAASELPPDAQGGKDVPSQHGIDIPVVEIIRTPLSEGESDNSPPQPDLVAGPVSPPPPAVPAEPTPSPASSPPPPPPALDLEHIATTRDGDISVRSAEAPTTSKHEVAPRRTTPPNPDAMVSNLRDSAPEPRNTEASRAATNSPPPAAVAPPPGFSGLREPTRQHGTITNRGPASVDAADTPVGRYMKEVTGAIEREWHRKRRSHADFVTYGTIKLEFSVNRQGQVQSLTIKNRNGANAVMQDFTLNAVLDAKIPPMPAGLPEIFDHDRLPISYDIIVY